MRVDDEESTEYAVGDGIERAGGERHDGERDESGGDDSDARVSENAFQD